MTTLSPELPDHAYAADERTTLLAMLDYYRAVLERKTSGLDTEQLTHTIAPSIMNLGGLLVHMAVVEEAWFCVRLNGEPHSSWVEDGFSFDTEPDWEFTDGAHLPPDVIRDRFHVAVERARDAIKRHDNLEQPTVAPAWDGEHRSLRWILVHMIEEYARHCGHADLLREQIDGRIGD